MEMQNLGNTRSGSTQSFNTQNIENPIQAIKESAKAYQDKLFDEVDKIQKINQTLSLTVETLNQEKNKLKDELALAKKNVTQSVLQNNNPTQAKISSFFKDQCEIFELIYGQARGIKDKAVDTASTSGERKIYSEQLDSYGKILQTTMTKIKNAYPDSPKDDLARLQVYVERIEKFKAAIPTSSSQKQEAPKSLSSEKSPELRPSPSVTVSKEALKVEFKKFLFSDKPTVTNPSQVSMKETGKKVYHKVAIDSGCILEKMEDLPHAEKLINNLKVSFEEDGYDFSCTIPVKLKSTEEEENRRFNLFFKNVKERNSQEWEKEFYDVIKSNLKDQRMRRKFISVFFKELPTDSDFKFNPIGPLSKEDLEKFIRDYNPNDTHTFGIKGEYTKRLEGIKKNILDVVKVPVPRISLQKKTVHIRYAWDSSNEFTGKFAKTFMQKIADAFKNIKCEVVFSSDGLDERCVLLYCKIAENRDIENWKSEFYDPIKKTKGYNPNKKNIGIIFKSLYVDNSGGQVRPYESDLNRRGLAKSDVNPTPDDIHTFFFEGDRVRTLLPEFYDVLEKIEKYSD